MKINKKLKYALVLSGGGARGLVHAGFLCALENAGYPPPSLIAGTSMGAIVGGLYAAGMRGPEMKRYILEELDVSDFMESLFPGMDGPVAKFLRTGQIIGNATTKPGIDSGNKVLKILEKLTDNKKFEDCTIPFLCNAVDLLAGQEVVFRSGSLARAIRASMSFPFVFEPLLENGKYLVDGAIAENLPIKSAREAGKSLGIRRILAVDTRRWRNIPAHSLKNGINVVMRCFETMIHVSEAENEFEDTLPRLLITISDKSSAFDFSRKRELLELGEAAAAKSKAELDSFFSAGFRGVLARRRKIRAGMELDGFFGGNNAKIG